MSWHVAAIGRMLLNTSEKTIVITKIVEDTILQGFEYRYFAIKDTNGEVCAVQPFFIVDQDVLVGTAPHLGGLIKIIHGTPV